MSEHHHSVHDRTHYGKPFFILLIFAVFEAWGGWWTNSLALLSDAAHMLADVVSLGLAWWAAHMASHRDVKRTFSGIPYPELWASGINAALMVLIIVGIAYEAFERLQSPPNVAGGAVFWIALVGLIVNLVVANQLKHHAHGGDNLNREAAYLHVLGDVVGSLAAILAGVVIYFTGWRTIDPLLSLLSAVLLTWMTVPLIHRIYINIKQ
jgi:cobalt-zinc-cadmium efflux system protein